MPGSTRFLLAIAILTSALVIGCRVFPATRPLPVRNSVSRGPLVVYRNLQPATDERLLDELVGMRQQIAAELRLPPAADESVHVYLFDNEFQYQGFTTTHFPDFPSRRAFFVDSNGQLTVYAHRNPRMVEDLRHEVAHGYLHTALPQLPLWLDEGLAEYFEVAPHLSGVNLPHVRLLQSLHHTQGWHPDLQRLESLVQVQEMTQAEYAEAWAWVYWMLHHSPASRELLTDHLMRSARGEDVEPLANGLSRLHYRPADTMLEFLLAVKF